MVLTPRLEGVSEDAPDVRVINDSRQSVVKEQHACLEDPDGVEHALFGEEVDLGTIGSGVNFILRQKRDVLSRHSQRATRTLRREVQADNKHGVEALGGLAMAWLRWRWNNKPMLDT